MNEILISFLSDTHGDHAQVQNFLYYGDILIFMGDCCNRASLKPQLWQLTNFLDWFKQFNYEHKIMIAGNHDTYCEKNPEKMKQLAAERGITYLYHEQLNLIVKNKNISMFGAPYLDWKPHHAFYMEEDALHMKHQSIPSNIDILISHAPPYGCLDRNIGCEVLRNTIKEKKPKIVCCGHIHEQGGVQKLFDTYVVNGAMGDRGAPMNLSWNPAVNVVQVLGK